MSGSSPTCRATSSVWRNKNNNNKNTLIQFAAAYFAYEGISVFPPHVGVGGDVHGFSLKRSQRAGVWPHKESCTFPVSQQVTHKLCQDTEKRVTGQHLSQVLLTSNSIGTNRCVPFPLFSSLGPSPVAVASGNIYNLKASLRYKNGPRVVHYYRLVMCCVLSYLFPSCSFDFEVLQEKYCASMVNGAGMAVRLVIKNCFVTGLVNFTLSPKSSETAWRLLSSGAVLKSKGQMPR